MRPLLLALHPNTLSGRIAFHHSAFHAPLWQTVRALPACDWCLVFMLHAERFLGTGKYGQRRNEALRRIRVEEMRERKKERDR